jgi:hypothetical protein
MKRFDSMMSTNRRDCTRLGHTQAAGLIALAPAEGAYLITFEAPVPLPSEHACDPSTKLSWKIMLTPHSLELSISSQPNLKAFYTVLKNGNLVFRTTRAGFFPAWFERKLWKARFNERDPQELDDYIKDAKKFFEDGANK